MGFGVSLRMSGWVRLWALSLILLLHSTLTVTFHISCLQHPIVVEVGSTTVLECQLIPKLEVKEFEVRWTKEKELVHLFRFGQDENMEQEARYKDRTQLFTSEFQNGNVSLKLTNVQLEDEGTYKCLVDTSTMDYQDATITLMVASLGDTPSVNLVKYTANGIQLLCESGSWYPAPEVEWKDQEGKVLPQQQREDLKAKPKSMITVKTYQEVTSGSGNTFSCSIKSERLNRIVGNVFSVPDEFYPRTSSWLYVFLLILFGTIALIVVLVLFYRKQKRHVRDLAKRPTAREHQLQKELNKKLRTDLNSLQTELDEIRRLPKTACQRITAVSVSVTLDSETAHPNLEVSSDQTTVSYAAGNKTSTDTDSRFTSKPALLGKDGYTSGRHFWVVEVGVETHVVWNVGIAGESVDRKDNQTLKPENGYWTIGYDGYKWHKYLANDASTVEISVKGKLQKIGIYVNYEAGQVLFCDAATFCHLHSFTSSFKGKIYPFFNLFGTGKIVILPSTTVKHLNNCT